MREDVAKYLLNLNPDSAQYDPKSRSMQENPLSKTHADYKGDTVQKYSGDYLQMIENETFISEYNQKAKSRGDAVLNAVAMPSQFEQIRKKLEAKKKEIRQKEQDDVDPYMKEALERQDLMKKAQARMLEVRRELQEKTARNAEKRQKIE